MSKFIVKFQREFDVTIEAETAAAAEQAARKSALITQLPKGTWKILSIIPEGYVQPEEEVLKPSTDLDAARNAKLAANVRALLPHGNDAA